MRRPKLRRHGSRSFQPRADHRGWLQPQDGAILGAIVYLDFRVDIRPALEQAGRWQVLGFFDIKEHFIAIGLALLPAYWVCWRQPHDKESVRARNALTSILAFIVWWGFLLGHVTNNIKGFGA